jgi:hypothetical protein
LADNNQDIKKTKAEKDQGITKIKADEAVRLLHDLRRALKTAAKKRA